MTLNSTISKTENKHRLTAFVDPTLVQRAKIRGALESLTMSEIVEKALDAYAPKIEKDSDQEIKLKFAKEPQVGMMTVSEDLRSKRKAPKHTKNLVVPR